MRNAIVYLLVSALCGGAADYGLATDGLRKDDAPNVATFTAVKVNGEDAICVSSPKGIVTARSITLVDGDQTFVITAKDKGLEIAAGAILIRAKDFQLLGPLTMKHVEILRIQLERSQTELIVGREETEPSHATEPAVESVPKSPH